MKAGVELLAVLGLAALAAAGAWWLAGPPRPPSVVACDPAAIGPEEVCLETVRNDAGVLWIDARTEAEWRRDGLPESIHLTSADFDELVAANGDRIAAAGKAVVYCGDLGCGLSREVAGLLRGYGLIQDARALHGGWAALKAAGLVTDSSREP